MRINSQICEKGEKKKCKCLLLLLLRGFNAHAEVLSMCSSWFGHGNKSRELNGANKPPLPILSMVGIYFVNQYRSDIVNKQDDHLRFT